MIIDAHQHVWNLERARYDWLTPQLPSINRTIEFDEITPILDRNHIDRTVLVQAADNDDDTQYMLEVAADHPEISGVVIYAPLDRPEDLSARLDELWRRPEVVGVRNLIHDQPDADWLLRPDVDEGLSILAARGVPFDVVSVLPRHLEHVVTVSARHPELRMVIDHLSKPPIKAGSDQHWRTLLTEAASNPNVYAKISGLYPASAALDDWGVEDLRPHVEFAYEQFGLRRLMYGGDWPVCITAGGYDKVWRALSTLFDELESHGREAVLASTAIEFYSLPVDRLPAGR